MMRRFAAVWCCSVFVLASCSDNPVAPQPDQRRPGDQTIAELARFDQGPGSEARPPDAPRTDLARVDLKPPVADTKPPVADTKPGTLQVTVTGAEVWANLMPPAAPDPTTVKLTLSLKNGAGQDVTGLKLTDGQLQPVPSGTAQAIELQAQAPFAGVVPAGQTVIVDFARVKKSTSVPLPTTCNGKLKVGFTVEHAGGTVGPLWSGDVTFVCAY